jgi:uncharacterized protein
MEKSKHTIISQIKDSDNWFIINSLSQQADILEPQMAKAYINGTLDDEQPFIEKGYLVNPKDEEKLFREKYLNSLDARDEDEVQLFFVPWYSCNFNCFYCYQDEYNAPKEPLEEEVVDAFFDYVNKKFAGRKKYITYFGGEPLLMGVARARTLYFFEKAKENGLDLSIVTNGFTLTEWIDDLKKYPIREVQVTVDGMAVEHTRRRPLKSNPNADTFYKIVDGIDAALEAGITINMRMVVDKDNIDDLPKMSDLAIEHGWTKKSIFKTQLGRNYELHHCQSEQSRLFTRVNMYEFIYEQIKKYPQILEFHKPAFSISKFISEQGQLPDPLFDACPAGKNEWAFDYTGNIYTCTATVGKKGEELGTYWPIVNLNEDDVDCWEERDVTSIPACKECSQALFCGGGCGSVSKNSNGGDVLTPDCRPIKELLEMGMSLYF